MAPHPQSPPVIGLIGGVGSGKSTIARWLAERRNVAVISGDAIGHQVLEDPETKLQIQEQFGTEVFDEAGLVNRSALAKVVFGPGPERQSARIALENIVHPEIERGISETIHHLQSSNPPPEAILLDAAVLLEAGWENVCDAVVFIESRPEQRLERVRGRGWTERELQQREDSQLNLTEKRTRADFVVHNDATLDEAGRQLQEIVSQLSRSGVK